MMVAKARVRRGELVVILMEDVVVGDIIAIEAGDLVPADGRILTAATLDRRVGPTGESSPVPKQIAAVAPMRRSAIASIWHS
jgi:Ca2+-transporting ATPase